MGKQSIAMVGAPSARRSRSDQAVGTTQRQENDEGLLHRTVAFWSRIGQRELATEQARQAVENITGFFPVLAEWDAAEKTREKATEKESA